MQLTDAHWDLLTDLAAIQPARLGTHDRPYSLLDQLRAGGLIVETDADDLGDTVHASRAGVAAIHAHRDQQIRALAFNPAHARLLGEGQILATYVPGGFWAVKVRQRDTVWAAFAVPRNGAVAEPFDIATGADRDAVESAAIRWANSATTAVHRLDRIVYAGRGDATNETPLAMIGVVQ